MAVHISTAQGGRAIGSHLPLNVALAILPTLPRPYLARLVANAIDRLDQLDGDADLEPEVTEQDDEPELDDFAEEDNEDCGHDEGEPDYRKRRRHRRNESGPGCTISDTDYGAEEIGEPIDGIVPSAYGIDQSTGPLSPYAN